MKNEFWTRVITLVVCQLLSLSALAQSVSSAACVGGGYTEGYFNGVGNTLLAAGNSGKALYNAGPAFVKGKVVSARLFYNNTGCKPYTLYATCLQDLAEVFIQRARVMDPTGTLAGRYEYFWESLGNGSPTFFQRLVQQYPQMLNIEIMEAQDLASEAATQSLNSLTHPPTEADYAMQEAMLTQLANDKEMLLLIGHSQGNLFAYHGIHFITPRVSEASVRGIHIAPAIYQAQLESRPYFLNSRDIVINVLRELAGPGSVPDPTLQVPYSFNDLSGHSLQGTYLDTSRAFYQQISDQIVKSLDELTPTPDPLCNGTQMPPPTTEPVYLPVLLAGLNVLKTNCTVRDPTGTVTIGGNGDVTGQGCLQGTNFPNGSTYHYSQTPTGTNDYLSIHVGSLGTETYANFGRDLNTQILVAAVRQPTGGSFNNGINFIWSYPAGDKLRIDTLARTKSIVGFISNRSCVAAVNGVTVATDAHIQIDASTLSVQQGTAIVASAPLSEFGTTSNITYLEDYGIFPGTTDQLSMASSGQSNQSTNFGQVTVLMPHKSVPSGFQFFARSLAQPDGTRVSVSCNSIAP